MKLHWPLRRHAARLGYTRPKASQGPKLGDGQKLVGVGDETGAVSAWERAAELRAQLATWKARPQLVETAGPCHVFAVLGQARADNQISPEGEANALSRLLTYWALKSSLETTAHCPPRIRGAMASAALA